MSENFNYFALKFVLCQQGRFSKIRSQIVRHLKLENCNILVKFRSTTNEPKYQHPCNSIIYILDVGKIIGDRKISAVLKHSTASNYSTWPDFQHIMYYS